MVNLRNEIMAIDKKTIKTYPVIVFQGINTANPTAIKFSIIPTIITSIRGLSNFFFNISLLMPISVVANTVITAI